MPSRALIFLQALTNFAQVQELSYLHNLIFRSDLHFMTQIHILADENIPGLDTLCGDWASISTRPGRAICAEDLKNIDILFVRSVTSVDSDLLDGSNVKFVGSATIGTDHLDIDYLMFGYSICSCPRVKC